jgi:hypothetical protein
MLPFTDGYSGDSASSHKRRGLSCNQPSIENWLQVIDRLLFLRNKPYYVNILIS